MHKKTRSHMLSCLWMNSTEDSEESIHNSQDGVLLLRSLQLLIHSKRNIRKIFSSGAISTGAASGGSAR